MTLRQIAGLGHLPAAVVGIGENPRATGWSYDRGGAAKIKRMCDGKELPWFNLFPVEPTPWPSRTARTIAVQFQLELQEKQSRWTLLLLGVKVCNAFGIEKPEWLEWYRSSLWGPLIAVPHPSGLNRWWNSRENTEAAADLLTKIAHGLLPRSDFGARDETA